MPFPYNFPFYFESGFSSSDAGSGTESLVSRLAGVAETGSGTGSFLLLAAFLVGDEGTGVSALKALIETAGSDMRLPGRPGQVRIPSKGVNL